MKTVFCWLILPSFLAIFITGCVDYRQARDDQESGDGWGKLYYDKRTHQGIYSGNDAYTKPGSVRGGFGFIGGGHGGSTS